MGWEADLLVVIKSPVTPTSIQALDLWAASEGMPAWENNWLATTWDGYGGVDVNGVGVKAYPSEADGVAATADTLIFGHYVGIVSTFQAAGSLRAIWYAINQSPWCSGCQGGNYPIALYQAMGSGVVVGPPAPPAPAAAPQATEIDNAYGQLKSYMQQDVPDYVIGLGWIKTAIDIANR